MVFKAGGLSSPPTNPIPAAPTIVSERVVKVQNHNKKGKPVGKPVFSGFELVYNSAMDPATAGLSSNYQVDAWVTKKGKKMKVLQPVKFEEVYTRSSNTVTLSVKNAKLFPKGGQIKILASSPQTGVQSASGALLNPSFLVFTISADANGIVVA
jgi:hypothetical protein